MNPVVMKNRLLHVMIDFKHAVCRIRFFSMGYIIITNRWLKYEGNEYQYETIITIFS